MTSNAVALDMTAEDSVTQDIILYDGDCGFCHGAVQFVIHRDPTGHFLFCPLQSVDTEQNLLERYGDTLVLSTVDGETYVRSEAIAHILSKLGGLWGIGGLFLKAIPRPLRDIGYRGVASIRRYLAPKPTDICPLLPVSLQKRFIEKLPNSRIVKL